MPWYQQLVCLGICMLFNVIAVGFLQLFCLFYRLSTNVARGGSWSVYQICSVNKIWVRGPRPFVKQMWHNYRRAVFHVRKKEIVIFVLFVLET